MHFTNCSLNVDSVLGYCLCLYYITFTKCTLVLKKWGDVEMQVNFVQLIPYVKTLVSNDSISEDNISSTVSLSLRVFKKPLLITISLSEMEPVYN